MSKVKPFLAALFAATVLAITLRAKGHWHEWFADLSWKFGSASAMVLGWLNSNVAAVGALVAIVGLLVNIYFQWKASLKK